MTATAWLATDLGAICEAFADYLADGKLELFEDAHGAERRAEMARLLLVGNSALGESTERKFVADAIGERLGREVSA